MDDLLNSLFFVWRSRFPVSGVNTIRTNISLNIRFDVFTFGRRQVKDKQANGK